MNTSLCRSLHSLLSLAARFEAVCKVKRAAKVWQLAQQRVKKPAHCVYKSSELNSFHENTKKLLWHEHNNQSIVLQLVNFVPVIWHR